MDQLTEQLNERTAAAVARQAVAYHLLTAKPDDVATTQLAGTTQPATQPVIMLDDQPVPQPKMFLFSPASEQKLPRFEASALTQFTTRPHTLFHARLYENGESGEGSYRYALPLLASDQCMKCHDSADAPLMAREQSDSSNTSAANTPEPPRLLGMVSVEIPSQIQTRQVLLNRVFILTAGLIAGILAIVIFYLVMTRLILQPVRVLQETAAKVSEGDLNIRSDINTGDEFQVLSETFNTMLTNLKNGADQLRAVNKSLDLKLGQLAESNVALYESNRLKNEFLANVSHELRTPLNSILGFAELLRELAGAAPDTKGSRYIQNIVNAGHNLLDLINDLLDLAKIEAGRMEVRSEPLSLADLFEALTSVLKPLTEAKMLTIVPTVQPNVPIVETDSSKLQQILYNFLSNAIKFSPTGGQIELVAEPLGDRIRINVTDHGMGIDPAQHGTIFEKFRQLDGSVTRQHSGTGLGLAISKELTTLLGGSIGVQSAVGAGATFWITLPLKNVAGQADVRSRLVLS